jgi:hypothetical protein
MLSSAKDRAGGGSCSAGDSATVGSGLAALGSQDRYVAAPRRCFLCITL